MRYTIIEHWLELEHREGRRITHREFAQRCGINTFLLNRLTNHKPVTTTTLERVATALRIPTAALIHSDEPETVDRFDGPAPKIKVDTQKAKSRQQAKRSQNKKTASECGRS